ncbi:hypothetical protein CDD81_2314 [Ophiocordyceps australis]|uniref:Uncharacterized protein n=1 Tax=Ophiocordyceps australis TaxID=1399860 RepID=A0A2C5YEX7_9HYPO|nr:hypothetical protein CDD81_2314 [Ophiocordyceps australis]
MWSLLRTSSSSHTGSDTSFNIGSSTSASSRSSTSTAITSPISAKTTTSPPFRRSGIRKQRLSRIRGGNRDRSGTTWIDDSDSDGSLSPLCTPSGAPCRFEIRRGKVVPQLSNADVILPSEQDDDIATPLPRLLPASASQRFSQQQWAQGRPSGWRPASSIYANSDQDDSSDSEDEHSPRGLVSADMYALSEEEISPPSSPDSATLQHARIVENVSPLDDGFAWPGSQGHKEPEAAPKETYHVLLKDDSGPQAEPFATRRHQVTQHDAAAQKRMRRAKSEVPRMPSRFLLDERPLPDLPPLPNLALADVAAFKKPLISASGPAAHLERPKPATATTPSKLSKTKQKGKDGAAAAKPLVISSAALSPTRRATIVPAPSIVQRMRLAGRSKPSPTMVQALGEDKKSASAVRPRPVTSGPGLLKPHISETAKTGATSTRAQKHTTLALVATPSHGHARMRPTRALSYANPSNLPPSPPPPMPPLPTPLSNLPWSLPPQASKVTRRKPPSYINTTIAAASSKARHSRAQHGGASKQAHWPPPSSRRSIATPSLSVGAPPHSVLGDHPPVPPLPPQSIFSMDLRRQTMAQDGHRPKLDHDAIARKPSRPSAPHYARHRSTATQSSVDSTFSSSSLLSVSKPLPLAPPELSTIKDPVAQLDVKMQVLAHRRVNLTRSIKQMTELMPSDSLLANDNVLRRREAEKIKVEALKEELAEVQRQEYDLGMKAHRARKRIERDSEYEQPTLWVRKVTG